VAAIPQDPRARKERDDTATLPAGYRRSADGEWSKTPDPAAVATSPTVRVTGVAGPIPTASG
jgi:hypothetical protein